MTINQLAQSIRSREPRFEWPGHRIGAEWLSPSKKPDKLMVSLNPSDQTPLVEAGFSQDFVELALEKAQMGLKNFREFSFARRQAALTRALDIFKEHKLALIRCLQLENGKTASEALHEVEAGIKSLESTLQLELKQTSGVTAFVSRQQKQDLTSSGIPTLMNHQSVGVTAAYLPSSAPFFAFVEFFSASLLAGSPLILVSSSHALLSTLFFSYLEEDLAFPAGICSLLFSDFPTFLKIVEDRRVASVLFVGSIERCQKIRTEGQRKSFKRLFLKAGGKNSLIIHASADPDVAADLCVKSAFINAGQCSSAANWVFVDQAILSKFKEQIIKRVSAIVVGSSIDDEALNAKYSMGPLHSQKLYDRFLRFLTIAHREETENWHQGRPLEKSHRGYFVTPSVHYFDELNSQSAFQSEILFSPSISVYGYRHLDEAIVMANSAKVAHACTLVGDPAILKTVTMDLNAPNVLYQLPTTALEFDLAPLVRLDTNEYFFRSHDLSQGMARHQMVYG